jgi:PAS domain S-box-containing protein
MASSYRSGPDAPHLSTLAGEEENLRALCETSPTLTWMSGPDKLCSHFNQRWLDFTGRTLEQELGEGWTESVHPDDLNAVLEQYSAAFDARCDFRIEYRLRRRDGSYRWIVDSGVPRRTADGLFVGYIGSCVDVTPVKEAEAALRRSEERYLLATAAGQVGVWDFDLDSGDIYVDPGLKSILGYEDDEIRNHIDDWGARVHPDDRDAVMQAVDDYLAGKTNGYEIEHRMLHKDGSERWFLARGCAFRDESGRPYRMVGTDTDITERRRVEAELEVSNARIRDLAGKMISAQEVERSRIARELHDGLNQQLAAVSIEVGFLRQHLSQDQIKEERLAAVQAQVQKISDSVRQMSHELHSPALEHLGLAVALKSHCTAFEEHEGIATAFNHHPIPEDLDDKVALCLYRVAQESLRNVARHADARQAWVNIRRVGDELVLTVADDGKGFVVESAGVSPGLGLVGMQERVRLVGGRFAISSGPRLGTRVEVRVKANGR